MCTKEKIDKMTEISVADEDIRVWKWLSVEKDCDGHKIHYAPTNYYCYEPLYKRTFECEGGIAVGHGIYSFAEKQGAMHLSGSTGFDRLYEAVIPQGSRYRSYKTEYGWVVIVSDKIRFIKIVPEPKHSKR